MDTDNTAVLMIDIQERLLPAMENDEEILSNIIHFVQGVMALNISTLVSEQYPKGLGNTVQALSQHFRGNVPTIAKTSFSCLGEQDIEDWITSTNRRNLLICGMETHICVMQTVLDLIEIGYTPIIISDCVASRFQKDKAAAMERMRDSGAVITTYEAVLFELLKDVKHPKFKEISNIIK